jgi:putative N6-adenine-specific DNA methylase
MIGERLKHQFKGNDAWVLSYREECFDQIGLKPSIKIPLYNGSLECEFRKYQMFDDKLKDFRSEGGIMKTEDEKRQMAEKHRFKKNREFKQRLEETEQNETGDIRSFTFHRHELEKPERTIKRREERDERREARGEKKVQRGKWRDERDERREVRGKWKDRNAKGSRKGGDYGKKRRFDDDED